jgi:hypothetical protein
VAFLAGGDTSPSIPTQGRLVMNTTQLIITSLSVLLMLATVAPLIWGAILDGRYHARHRCAHVRPHTLDS